MTAAGARDLSDSGSKKACELPLISSYIPVLHFVLLYDTRSAETVECQSKHTCDCLNERLIAARNKTTLVCENNQAYRKPEQPKPSRSAPKRSNCHPRLAFSQFHQHAIRPERTAAVSLHSTRSATSLRSPQKHHRRSLLASYPLSFIAPALLERRGLRDIINKEGPDNSAADRIHARSPC